MTTYLGPVIFPNPYAAVGITALAALNVAAAINESKGENMPYSKFAHESKAPKKLPGRVGMAIAYGGGLLASAVGCAWLMASRGAGAQAPSKVAGGDLPVVGSLIRGGAQLVAHAMKAGRPMLVAAMLLGHFAKREAEVAFVHKYSGGMDRSSAVAICATYTLTALLNLAAVAAVPDAVFHAVEGDARVEGVSVPVALGSCLYVIGQAGNLYHHWLLARLRSGPAGKQGAAGTAGGDKAEAEGASAAAPAAGESGAEKKYYAPKGGLFGQVVCPHYLFELVAWSGMAVASQHYQGFLTVAGMTAYLAGRARSTRQWYQDKGIQGFPGDRKCLVPGLF